MTASDSTRARRFALPDLQDDRSGESIEAFLHGRKATGPERAAAAHSAAAGDAVALRSMPGRLEWNAAFEREVARTARYDRPTAVAIVELRPLRPTAAMDSWLRIQAGPVGQVLLHGSRAADVVARVGPTRFQVLLPETSRAAAGEFVERVIGECHERLQAAGAPVRVASALAASSPETPLREALAQAVRSLEAA